MKIYLVERYVDAINMGHTRVPNPDDVVLGRLTGKMPTDLEPIGVATSKEDAEMWLAGKEGLITELESDEVYADGVGGCRHWHILGEKRRNIMPKTEKQVVSGWHRPVCKKCGCEFRPETNEVGVLDMNDNGAYELFDADLWKCPKCHFEIVGGFGFNPISAHYENDFQEQIGRYEKRGLLIKNEEEHNAE